MSPLLQSIRFAMRNRADAEQVFREGLVAAHDAGYSLAQIARAIGMSKSAVAYQIRQTRRYNEEGR